MGIVKMPSFEEYWSQNCRYSLIGDEIPIETFKKVRCLLDVEDNTTDANGDHLFKIRPLIEMIRINFGRIKGEKLYSIVEMMISYKGTKAGNLRQYLLKKPKNGVSKCLE